MKILFIFFVQFLLSESLKCVNTYQDLKVSIRSNRTANVQHMLNAFYPPNESTNHVINVHYCVNGTRDMEGSGDGVTDADGFLSPSCNQTIADYHFQWLVNSLPLVTDSDVLQANTFYFAGINHKNLSLNIMHPFCENIDPLPLLETFTVWLKSYALGDEDTIEGYCVFLSNDNENKSADGYVRLFHETNETIITINESILLLQAKKFIIGLWLGVSSLTFALILHVGRCSIGAANALNKVLWDITQAVNKFVNIPNAFLKVLHSVTHPDGKKRDKSGGTDEAPKEENTGAEEDKGSVKAETKIDKAPIEGSFKASSPEIHEEISQHDKDSPRHKKEGNEPLEQSSTGIEMISFQKNDDKQQNLEMETEFNELNVATQNQTVTPKELRQQHDIELDHAFAFFAKSIRKASTTSILLLIAFIIYDSYAYFNLARMNSYDWFVLFPFPFWFTLVLFVNLTAFFITEIILCCKPHIKENHQTESTPHKGCCVKCFTMVINFFTTISATTLPVFVFFHTFWLAMASSLFAIRIASSALFYIPLLIFVFWFLSITSWIMRVWKQLIKKEIKKETRDGPCKRIFKLIPLFIRPLIPYLFLPFWALLLATLQMFSATLHGIIDLEKHNFLVVVTTILGVIGITKKIADHCKPSVDKEDESEEDLKKNN